MSDIYRWVDQHIRWHMSRRSFPAEVVSKDSDGVSVSVKRLGFETTEGPYPTERGAWGALRVGDRCRVRHDGPVPIVGLPVELTAPANQMQRVGEDLTADASTDSADDWVTLLDTGETLVIPATSAFEIWWSTTGETNGSTSTNQMNIRAVFNDLAGDALNVGQPGQSSAERAFVSPYSTPAGFRMVGGQIGTFIYDADVGEVNRVRLQGKTNAPDDLAILHAYGLVVFQ